MAHETILPFHNYQYAMDVRFDGKRALVTGAGKGIGRAIAIALMKGGADTYALSRTQSDLDSLEKEVPGIKTVFCDVSDWDLTKSIVQDIIKDGPIELLVNNAGVGTLEAVGTIKNEVAMETIKTNLLASMNISQEVVQGLKIAGKEGSIINMSSVAGLIAFPVVGACSYSASKGGMDAMTRVMAMELGPHKIRANSINPTTVWTDIAKRNFKGVSKLEKLLSMTPMGRLAEVEDVVNATLFLLSDKAAMITGVSLPVDGGLTAC